MKKHLRGKRHTIARRSVAVGRYKRKVRKFERQWDDFSLSLLRVSLGLEEMAGKVKEAMERISASMGVPVRFLVPPKSTDRRVQHKD